MLRGAAWTVERVVSPQWGLTHNQSGPTADTARSSSSVISAVWAQSR